VLRCKCPLPVSVCLYQPLSKPGRYRKATLAKHYFCWVPVQCPPTSQILSLLFLTLYLHSKTTLCVNCSAHEFVSSTIKHLQWKMHTNINTIYIQLQSSPTRKQISATGCHDNTHFLFQYLDNYVQCFTLSTTGRKTRTIFFLTSQMCQYHILGLKILCHSGAIGNSAQ